MDSHRALTAALAAVGGPSALARLLGNITSQAVSQWRRVPATRVYAVEKATGISRRLLRPDVFCPPPISKRRRRNAR